MSQSWFYQSVSVDIFSLFLLVGVTVCDLRGLEELEILRCGKVGQLYHPDTTTCQQPLTSHVCPGGMLVLDSERLVGRCVERGGFQRYPAIYVQDQAKTRVNPRIFFTNKTNLSLY